MDSYKSRAAERADKAELVRLHDALNASAARLRRDDCGLWVIRGRGGNYISTWGNGSSWTIYVCLADRPVAWTWAKKRLIAVGLVVTQNGDDEGVFRLDRLPDPETAALIRKVVGIRQRSPGGQGFARQPVKDGTLAGKDQFF
jgi:hypothetical protein